MSKILMKLLTVLAAVFAVSATPAMAQATRTWVSGVGDDVNPCSRTAPCKTFAGAISKTAAAGEINVLDPGGYGAVTITKSITIRSDSVEAGIVVSGTNGITINAGINDTVTLDGLDIEGLGNSPKGIQIAQARAVRIVNTRIHNFTVGIGIPTAAKVTVYIDKSRIEDNGIGLQINSTGPKAIAYVTRSLLTGNGTAGVSVDGATNRVFLSDNEIFGSLKAVERLNGGLAAGSGNNSLNENVTDVVKVVPQG